MDEQYSYCPRCALPWDKHPKGDCDEGRLIELDKPKFYSMDLNNYVSDFLIDIIKWQDRKITFLEALHKTREEKRK